MCGLHLISHRLGTDMTRTALQRSNLGVVCGKDLKQGLEHFTTWKALLNIHKTLVYGSAQIIFKHKVKYSIVAMAVTKPREDNDKHRVGATVIKWS